MRILSLYDGMSCGMLALLEAGVQVDRYVAYEIDKYAVKTSKHNFPQIEHMGDVFAGDFTQYYGFDFVIAGFPCTTFSIAQKSNRETAPYSGPGWVLFEQAWRAVLEAKPRFFFFENNESMAKPVQKEISKIIGFEPYHINSALVSAQNRKRIYWVGKRNPDGTYSRVDVQQPEDRGILLRDVLDGVGGEPINTTAADKACTLKTNYGKTGIANVVNGSGHYPNSAVSEPVRVGTYPGSKHPEMDSKQYRAYSPDGKTTTFCGEGGGLGAKTGLYALPVSVRFRGRDGGGQWEAREDEKAGSLGTTDVSKHIVVPVSKSELKQKIVFSCGGSYTRYSVSPGYAIPCIWDKDGRPNYAKSGADGKEHPVYEVYKAQITTKGKTYPIKLLDGYYIIRKLTVSECKRLQTVPEW